jgi:flavin reductase (DIM6/NTAB) family NADH-FMN oxidoreductase RutF
MEKHFDFHELMNLPARYRGTLINKIAGYKTANLIGTRSGSGMENLALFNSVVHIGANPPYLGFVLRPTTVERHTYKNLRDTGQFTINQVAASFHREAHQTSGKYPLEVSEFKACGLTPHYVQGFSAPFVAESRIKIGLSFEEEHLVNCNQTRLVVGKIEHLILPEGGVKADGDVDLEALNTVAIGGLDTYYTGKKLGRYGYYRPGDEVREID